MHQPSCDAYLVTELLDLARRQFRLTHVRTLAEALAHLAAPGPAPDVVVLDLDLGLPDAEGIDSVPRVVAAAPSVVVMTTSSAQDDIRPSYRLHANAHVVKPTDYSGFAEILTEIEDFFARVAQLPCRLP